MAKIFHSLLSLIASGTARAVRSAVVGTRVGETPAAICDREDSLSIQPACRHTGNILGGATDKLIDVHGGPGESRDNLLLRQDI